MTPSTAEIAPSTIAWAAELLVDRHGTFAPLYAARAAADMTEVGRDDLACTWQIVRGLAESLIAGHVGTTAPALN